MLDLKGTELYWEDQTKKGDNPCHYHDKWQDAYAFRMRTKAFKKHDFDGVTKVTDVGCGIGDYTNEIAKLSKASFLGFDFPFNIELAKKKYAGHSQLSFVPKSLPDEEVMKAISEADAAITTTVYVHMAPPAREAFLVAAGAMRKGSKVMLLEYMPDAIPDFQKNLPHKEVETPNEITLKFEQKGFETVEIRHVNFLDSFLFHHLGRNFLSYYLTIFIEFILKLTRYPHSKYKLLIFRKMA